MDFCQWGSNASACYASLKLIHCNNLKHSNFNFLKVDVVYTHPFGQQRPKLTSG